MVIYQDQTNKAGEEAPAEEEGNFLVADTDVEGEELVEEAASVNVESSLDDWEDESTE